MTGVDVEHTKALAEKATPGPWEAYPNRDVKGIAHIRIPLAMHPTAWTADAEFIAHARSAVPALVAAVDRVQALHTPVSLIVDGKPYGTLCRECTDIDIVNAWECDDGDPDDGYIEHPCNTIRALETPK